MIGLELTPEHPLPELAALARRAERVGFDTVFVSHHYNNRDEFLALGEIARATETVELGPGVTNPYETHPATLASRMATVDELADGRGIFGVGPGDASTLANLGYDQDQPLRRVLETIRVARRLWAGETVSHEGIFQTVDASLNYEGGSIPVYVGAQGPHMTRMAAKHADGVLYNGSHHRDIEWAADRVQEGLVDRPPERGSFDFAAYASVSVDEDPDSAREEARPPVAFIVGGAPPPVLQRHGIETDRAAAIGESIEHGAFSEAFDSVTPAMIDAFCIAGTPAEIASRLVEIQRTADSLVLGAPLGPDLADAIDLMGAVLPSCRE